MKKILLTLFIIFCISKVRGQEALTLYNMEAIGQSTLVNPSLMPSNKMYIGIPALSSTTFFFSNSAFNWRQLHKTTADDSVSLDIENVINNMPEKNFITLAIRSDILGFGIKVKQNYFTMNISERANFNMTFPKELFELLFHGNGAFIGQEIDLKRMSFDVTHYREYSIGFARELNKKVTIGGRLKYLYGMENYSSAKSNLSFYTAPDDYRIELTSDYVINTSSSANASNGNSGNYLTGLKNTGWGGDVSISYNKGTRWKLNASVIDFGYIRWTSNVKNLVTASGSYSFEGVDINQFISDSTSSFDNVMDSISDSFKPVENNDSYTTSLSPHIYLNAVYKLNEKTNVSGLIHAKVFRSTVQPTFTAALDRRLSNHVSATLSYSMINQNWVNIGGGIVMHAGAFQFYAISDNLLGTINPFGHNTAHVQFGFNLIYGRFKDKKVTTNYGVQKKATPTNTQGAVEPEPLPEIDPEKKPE